MKGAFLAFGTDLKGSCCLPSTSLGSLLDAECQAKGRSTGPGRLFFTGQKRQRQAVLVLGFIRVSFPGVAVSW